MEKIISIKEKDELDVISILNNIGIQYHKIGITPIYMLYLLPMQYDELKKIKTIQYITDNNIICQNINK